MILKLKLMDPEMNVDLYFQVTRTAKKAKKKLTMLQKYILVLHFFLKILQKMKSLSHTEKI